MRSAPSSQARSDLSRLARWFRFCTKEIKPNVPSGRPEKCRALPIATKQSFSISNRARTKYMQFRARSDRRLPPPRGSSAHEARQRPCVSESLGFCQPATYFNWKKRYDGLLPTEMRRRKQLEDENGKLKKLVSEQTLDREMLQDVIRRKL
jgi:putative transposase